MSHPENTFKQIIERQDEKINLLLLVIETMLNTDYYHEGKLSYETYMGLLGTLNKVRKL